jgi:hypothetical protein
MRAILLGMAAVALIGLTVTSGASRADRDLPVTDTCPEALEARYFPNIDSSKGFSSNLPA